MAAVADSSPHGFDDLLRVVESEIAAVGDDPRASRKRLRRGGS